jgi:TIGR03009 family protein
MRCAALVLAGPLVAACASAQPPAPKADLKLDAHLGAWEKKMAGVSNFFTELALTRTEATFKRKTQFKGSVQCMKPNFAILHLASAADANEYERYHADGQNLYVFDGAKKTVTRVKLKQNQRADNVMLDFLNGMKAKDVKARFDAKLFKEDDNYIYLDLKPLHLADQREFKELRMALYKDTPATAKWAYLPSQVYLQKPGGDSELWEFTNTQLDIKGVDAKTFAFQGAPKGFELKDAPELPDK